MGLQDHCALVAALHDLERVHQDLALIAERTDDARRDLIARRRELSALMARIGPLAEAAFAADPAALRRFRSLFSTMRSAAALHQANWPAVRLNDDRAAYQLSALVVRDANRRFVAWLREALAS